jgi:acetyl esterase/lipase
MRHRKRLIVLLLLILTLALTGMSQQQPRQGDGLEDPAWVKELASERIVYSVPGMEQTRVRKDLTYKRVAQTELKMDVYSPSDLTGGTRRPAVLFIHGGRIPANLRTKPKEWGAYVSFGQLVAASGFIGVTFNHRFYEWSSLSDSQTDVADAIAYLRDNAESLGVDKDRIILWAVSAGGLFLSQSLRDAPPYIRCIVSYYAVLDLHTSRKGVPATITDETLKKFSPLYQLRQNGKGIPPLFIVRAGLDDADLNGGVDRFIQEALSKNVAVDLSNHAQGHHGFDVLDNNERSREIIKRTLEFIQAHS